jgi:hypothetical protein
MSRSGKFFPRDIRAKRKINPLPEDTSIRGLPAFEMLVAKERRQECP